MIIDGEELKMVCQDCGNKFKYIIGYGPVYPTFGLQKQKLRENPPICPKCHSKNVKRCSIWDLFK